MQDKRPRRQLEFNNLDEVVIDAENLLAKGYAKAGNWDLAQVSRHVAAWMRFAIDGYPKMGCVMGQMMWLMRHTMGRRILRSILREGRMKEQIPTVPTTVSQPGSDESSAVADLKDAVDRFGKHVGEYHPSSFFGRWTREECLKLNLVHAAHHLSYLIPKSE
jgi:Protein of unknown function (DUF1569)